MGQLHHCSNCGTSQSPAVERNIRHRQSDASTSERAQEQKTPNIDDTALIDQPGYMDAKISIKSASCSPDKRITNDRPATGSIMEETPNLPIIYSDLHTSSTTESATPKQMLELRATSVEEMKREIHAMRQNLVSLSESDSNPARDSNLAQNSSCEWSETEIIKEQQQMRKRLSQLQDDHRKSLVKGNEIEQIQGALLKDRTN